MVRLPRLLPLPLPLQYSPFPCDSHPYRAAQFYGETPPFTPPPLQYSPFPCDSHPYRRAQFYGETPLFTPLPLQYSPSVLLPPFLVTPILTGLLSFMLRLLFTPPPPPILPLSL